MKIGNIELTEERLIIAIGAGIAVIGLGVYLIFYAPLINKIKTKYIECKSVEGDVLECRNMIECAEKTYGERILMEEKHISHAIDELTKHGKLKGINFISMSPKKIQKGKDLQYKILPIDMEIESTYEGVGIFLGSLDELEKGLVKVKSFDIVQDKEDPTKHITDLVVDLYISGKQDEG